MGTGFVRSSSSRERKRVLNYSCCLHQEFLQQKWEVRKKRERMLTSWWNNPISLSVGQRDSSVKDPKKHKILCAEILLKKRALIIRAQTNFHQSKFAFLHEEFLSIMEWKTNTIVLSFVSFEPRGFLHVQLHVQKNKKNACSVRGSKKWLEFYETKWTVRITLCTR